MYICGMFSKWKIKGLDNYVFGNDNKLYRLPYTHNGKSYGIREIKLQYPSRYKIGNSWLSQRQMRHRLILDDNPIELIKTKELPF